MVRPSLIDPLNRDLDQASTFTELTALRKRISEVRVLDPACGSGNFLYVAYRELRRFELALLDRIFAEHRLKAIGRVLTRTVLSTEQFYGIDKHPFAVELAKVTLTLARELAIKELQNHIEALEGDLPGSEEAALPFENLDNNIVARDALFSAWPEADVIIGNPPFQSKNKAQKELGADYLGALRRRYPDVPGRADYCVYWFRRAHDHLRSGCRAGLVGTNTIRQNYSRIGGLDYIVENGGTITEAVSTQVWSGDAAVHVSIVNWTKGRHDGPFTLHAQLGDKIDSPERTEHPPFINSSLSFVVDVSKAQVLETNAGAGICFQGQTHGHDGFLVDRSEGERWLSRKPELRDVLFPYLIGNDLLGNLDAQPSRYVIDFHPQDVLQSAAYEPAFSRVKKLVLPDREQAAAEEASRNQTTRERNPAARVNLHHHNFLEKWWTLSYPRGEMKEALGGLRRFVACVRVTKRPIFEMVATEIRPNDALMVFALEDDYSFGILQSGMHWEWFKARCSTLEERFRYTSNTVFDSFPWPQSPAAEDVKAVAEAAVELRRIRREVMRTNGWTLRKLYRSLDQPGQNPLRAATESLDSAVRQCYGMADGANPLAFLLALNQKCAAGEQSGDAVTGPGLPASAGRLQGLVSKDCVRLL